MKHPREVKAITAYFKAKEYVVRHGYSEELIWQDNISFSRIDESYFLREAAWVILNSGMRESVIAGLFPQISDAFFEWENSNGIYYKREICFAKALAVFNNPGKIGAIITIAEDIALNGFQRIKKEIELDGINRIQAYPYMGNATSYHFAKNIGLDCAKPDRHLLRIAAASGYNCPNTLCEMIANYVMDKTSVVDLVFWRFATLNRNYLELFEDA